MFRAIAHGWRPKSGDVRKIPKSVAIDFMRADMARKGKRPRKRTIAEGSK
jgi:hypothetical protein